jgi:hypothetical protein
VDSDIDPKPNYLELDEERSKLLEKILLGSSINARLDAYLNYFLKILSFNRSNIEEAFLSEFLEDYLNVVKRYEVWGNDPELTCKIFEQLLKIKDRHFTEDYVVDINNEIARLESQWTDLTNILNGIENNSNAGSKAYFPVLENDAPVNCYGLIETVTVRINKTDRDDKFIIIPSEKEIEQRIQEQIKLSWKLALQISNKYIRKHHQYHEVIISFDKKAGFYMGNSLGIALTLTFLEQILKFYNPTFIINISEGSAFTGGIDTKGNVLNTGEDIIKRKVAAIFYSDLNFFVFPKLEESYAYFALEQLRKVYPQRKLKLIPAEDFDDILNRRDLVEIKKQKAIVRTGKFVKKNWISAIATVLLAILFAYLFVMDFDDNPATFTVDGHYVYIRNKNEKILWQKSFTASKEQTHYVKLLKHKIRLLDINSDGLNEVLLVDDYEPGTLTKLDPPLICYDRKGREIWRYNFRDKVNSDRENLSENYNLAILDTLKIFNEKYLFMIASNLESFSSAIFSIKLISGKRNAGTLWTSGHTVNALLNDINYDGKKDIVGLGFDNGYEDLVFFGFEIDTLTSCRSTEEEYLISNYPIKKMSFYIRIPKTDFDEYYKHSTPRLFPESLTYHKQSKRFSFLTTDDYNEGYSSINYNFNNDIVLDKIIFPNDFRIRRDTLVAQGKILLPYTDTREYEKKIKDKILYWKEDKWVTLNDTIKK